MLNAHDEPVPPQGIERRGSPRVDWPVTADLLKRVSVDHGGTSGRQHAQTVNISLLALPFPCEPGTELALRFPLDRSEEMAGVVRVVRIDERSDASGRTWLVGCEFVELLVEERCRLAKFLMRRRAAVIDAHARATGRAGV